VSRLNTWLWSGTLEEVLLTSDQRVNAVEAVLLARGKIKSSLPEALRSQQVRGILHNAGQDIELWSNLVEAFENEGLFARTEVNMVLEFIMDGF
jgi:hypothetical protein